MKKIIALTLSLVLLLSLAYPVNAVTPALRPPDLPDIPDISGSVHVELSEDYWDGYFEDNPITIKPEKIPAPSGNGLTHIHLQPISRPSWWEWLMDKYT